MNCELRAPTGADMVRLAEWGQDPDVAPLTPAAGPMNSPLFMSIYVNDVHVGTCSICNVNEIGIVIGRKEYWGKGIGTWAVRTFLNTLSHPHVWLKVLPSNTRAIRCYEKCGFVRTGKLSIDGHEFIKMARRK